MAKHVFLWVVFGIAYQGLLLAGAAEEPDSKLKHQQSVPLLPNEKAVPIILAGPCMFSALVGIASGIGTAITAAVSSVSAHGGLVFATGKLAAVGAGAAGTAASGAGAAAAHGAGIGISLHLPTFGQTAVIAAASALKLKVLLANIQERFKFVKDQVRVIVNGVEALLPLWMASELQEWVLQQEKDAVHATARRVREKFAEWWRHSRANPWHEREETSATTTTRNIIPGFVSPTIRPLPLAHLSNLAKYY